MHMNATCLGILTEATLSMGASAHQLWEGEGRSSPKKLPSLCSEPSSGGAVPSEENSKDLPGLTRSLFSDVPWGF